MVSWMVVTFIVGFLNLLAWKDHDPLMQVNGGLFFLLGLGLMLQWHYKVRKKRD